MLALITRLLAGAAVIAIVMPIAAKADALSDGLGQDAPSAPANT